MRLAFPISDLSNYFDLRNFSLCFENADFILKGGDDYMSSLGVLPELNTLLYNIFFNSESSVGLGKAGNL